jgi:hypothetical protein
VPAVVTVFFVFTSKWVVFLSFRKNEGVLKI